MTFYLTICKKILWLNILQFCFSPPWNKKKSKGSCDFLPQKSDFYITSLYVTFIKSDFSFFSELRVIYSHLCYFLAILTFFPDLLFCVYISQFWETEKINSEIKRCNYLKDLHKPWYSHIYPFKDKCELLFCFHQNVNTC